MLPSQKEEANDYFRPFDKSVAVELVMSEVWITCGGEQIKKLVSKLMDWEENKGAITKDLLADLWLLRMTQEQVWWCTVGSSHLQVQDMYTNT